MLFVDMLRLLGLTPSKTHPRLAGTALALCMVLPGSGGLRAQTPAGAETHAAAAPVISLQEAIRRAQMNEPNYAAARAASRAAGLDASIARSALLPSAVFHNQMLYTQPNGLTNQAGQGVAAQPAPKFIANNAVREYASQAVVNETLGLAQFANVQRANAAAALARAQLEIARRGLVATVTLLYYGALAAQEKVGIADQAEKEASDFVSLTSKRERGREAAHADVVKAQLLEQQRVRDLADARLTAENERLDLGVLLFSDPRTTYTLQADANPAPLPSRADIEAAAGKNNPDLESALAAVNQSNAEVFAARAAYLPDLGINYNYGIDAPQFAANGPDGVRNLGYSASVTVDVPVWDWFGTQHRIKQSEIRRDAAKIALTATQRQLIARLDEAYRGAVTARDQLASLDTSVNTAAESLRLTKLRYTAGEATVLEVVDAQTAFSSAEIARADGRIRYQSALATLQTLTGTM